ncbi:nucleoprotein TPR [Fonsecaea erecta]|uniref:Nucleoprotein TPR n=1 Tax=Fonsecaea erecta TaxID=1367422 RepID=A0A178ZKH8_9EURO|nr:nucleoprotein TPR [Fonsecaea erecta]OAP59916.1 nucleoprotein TPR [Fonsecaea erecta]
MEGETGRPSSEEAEAASEDRQSRGRDAKPSSAKHEWKVYLSDAIASHHRAVVALQEEPYCWESILTHLTHGTHCLESLEKGYNKCHNELRQEEATLRSGRKDMKDRWESFVGLMREIKEGLRWLEDPEDPSTRVENLEDTQQFGSLLQQRILGLMAQRDEFSQSNANHLRKISELEDTITRLKNERDNALRTIGDLEVQVETLHKENIEKGQTITSVERMRDERLKLNDDYFPDIMQPKTSVDSLVQEIRAEKERYARVKREKDKVTKGKQDVQGPLVSLSKEKQEVSRGQDLPSKDNDELGKALLKPTDLGLLVEWVLKGHCGLDETSECISKERADFMEGRDKFAEGIDKLSQETGHFGKAYNKAVDTNALREEASQRDLEDAWQEKDAKSRHCLEIEERLEGLSEDCSRGKESLVTLEETCRATTNHLQGKITELNDQFGRRTGEYKEERKLNVQLRDDCSRLAKLAARYHTLLNQRSILIHQERTRADNAELEAQQATNALQELKDEMEDMRKQADQARADMAADFAERQKDCEDFQQSKIDHIRYLEGQLNACKSFAAQSSMPEVRLSTGGMSPSLATSPVGGTHVQRSYSPLPSGVGLYYSQDRQDQWQPQSKQTPTEPEYQEPFQIPDLQISLQPVDQAHKPLAPIQLQPQPPGISSTRLMTPNNATNLCPATQTLQSARPVMAGLIAADDPASPTVAAQTHPLGRPPKRRADPAEYSGNPLPALKRHKGCSQ